MMLHSSILFIIFIVFFFMISSSNQNLKDIHGNTLENFEEQENEISEKMIDKEDLFSKKQTKEETVENRQCPDLLVQKNGFLYLYNTRMLEVPGVNPVRLENLDEYNEFVKWQRHQGFNCPVLFVQYTYDSQGNLKTKVRKDPFDLDGGLPPAIVQNNNQINNDYKNIQRLLTTGEDAGKETINMERMRTQVKDIKANHEKGKFVPHSFDPYNQTVGKKTELDSMYAKDNIM